MAQYVLEDCKLYLDKYNLSGDMNNLALNPEIDVIDDTTFSSNGARRKVAGLQNVTADFQGYYEAGEGKVDDALFNAIGAVNSPVTICPTDGAAGEPGYIFRALTSQYSPGATVGEIFAFTVTAEGSGKLVKGTVMLNGALTATGTGTARQLGAVTATQKLYAAIHAVTVSGTDPTLDLVVQSDDAEGFTDPTDRITFAQLTDEGSEWATPVAGAITDDWWRLSYTISGTDPSFTCVVVVGIL